MTSPMQLRACYSLMCFGLWPFLSPLFMVLTPERTSHVAIEKDIREFGSGLEEFQWRSVKEASSSVLLPAGLCSFAYLVPQRPTHSWISSKIAPRSIILTFSANLSKFVSDILFWCAVVCGLFFFVFFSSEPSPDCLDNFQSCIRLKGEHYLTLKLVCAYTLYVLSFDAPLQWNSRE